LFEKVRCELNFEARNPKSETSTKFELMDLRKAVLNFDHLVFEFVSGFEIRIS